MSDYLQFALYVSAAWVAFGTLGLFAAMMWADRARTVAARRRARIEWLQCAGLIYVAGPASLLITGAVVSLF